GKINLQGQAHGTWPALNAEGALHADNLLYQGNHLQTLHLTYTGAQLGDQPQVTAQLRAQQARAGTIPVEHVTLDATYQAADRQETARYNPHSRCDKPRPPGARCTAL